MTLTNQIHLSLGDVFMACANYISKLNYHTGEYEKSKDVAREFAKYMGAQEEGDVLIFNDGSRVRLVHGQEPHEPLAVQ